MKQLIRYGLVGIASNATIYGAYLLMTHHGIEPKIAMTLTYIIGVTIGFVGNRKWTFTHHGSLFRTSIRYLFAHLLGYMLNFLLLFTFVDYLGYPHQWVQATAIIVVAGFLFIVFKYFVFRKNHTNPAQTI